MNTNIIYHIVTIKDWELQKNNNTYSAASLALEGFIHCSTKEQLFATIHRYYANEKSVIVLHIDIQKLNADLKYELAPSFNQFFPHIYGTINVDAIIKVEEVNV